MDISMKKIKQWLAKRELAWGKLQADKIRHAEYSKADGLFKNAYKRLSSAASLDAKNAEIFHYWGLVLYEQAQHKQGKEAKELCKIACEKFAVALKLEPDNAKIMNDWGAALIEQARNKPDKYAAPFYQEAKEKIVAADSLEPGLGAYNLACIHSLRGEQRECQKYLEQAREMGNLPVEKYLKMDEDLDNVRNEMWFKNFIQSLSEEAESKAEEAETQSQNKPEESRKNIFHSWWRRLKQQ
jgi:Tfp pilus assembly protein PilF